MIILTCQLKYETGGKGLLSSVVYDDIGDRFVRTCQKISAELAQGLNTSNPMIDINDFISLDYIESVLDGDELDELLEKLMNDLGGGSYSLTPIPEFVKVGRYSSISDKVEFHTGHLNHLC